MPLTGVGGGPVEEDGQSVARRPIREATKRQLSPGDMAHVDEEGVVGGVEAAGVHTGVLIHPTVQQSPGQQSVYPLLVESCHGLEQTILSER